MFILTGGSAIAQTGFLPYQSQLRESIISPPDVVFQLLSGTSSRKQNLRENTRHLIRETFAPPSFTPPKIFNQVSAVWIGGSGNWSVPANWSGGVVPNNGTPAGTTYAVIIDNIGGINSIVSLNIPVTIDSLTIDAGDRLNINDAQSLTVINSGAGTGTIVNNGILALNASVNFTDLIINGNVTLSGSGNVQFSSFVANRIYGVSTSDTLTNQSNTISGSGIIGKNSMLLNNQGTIRADTSGDLYINPSFGATTSNSGTIEVSTSSGTVVLTNGVFDNTGGVISATLGTVDVSGIFVTGGTVNVSNSSTLRLGGEISGGTLNNSGTITVLAGTLGGTINNLATGSISLSNGELRLTGGAGNSYTNAGTISLNSTGSFTDLVINGDVTLIGNGNVLLSNSAMNRIYGLTATDTLTNQDNTITGAGNIGNNSMTLNNQGFIKTDFSNGLTIDPGSGGVTNSGTIQATTPSVSLIFNDGTYNNNGGTISANVGTIQVNANAFVTGGTVNVANSSMLRLGGGSVTGGTLNNSGSVFVPAGMTGTIGGAVTNNATGQIQISESVLVLNGGIGNTYSNAGTISLNSMSNFSDLVINGDVTLGGGGNVLLSNSILNRIYGMSATNVLTNQGNTISGAGQIGNNSMSLNNQGKIRADATNILVISLGSGGGFGNSGTIESFGNSSTLILSDGTFNMFGDTISSGSETVQALPSTNATSVILNNTGGVISATLGSVQVYPLASVTGGTVNVANSSTLRLIGGSVTGGTLNNSGAISVQMGMTATLGGTINNLTSGSINLLGTPIQPTGLTVPTTSNFNNSGSVSIDRNSTLTMNTGVNYTQTAGITAVMGNLTASGGQVNLLGGILNGSGFLNADLINGGRLEPGTFAPGIIQLNGNYTQTPTGLLEIELNGTVAGSGYDAATVRDATILSGTLSVSSAFTPTVGETFTILPNLSTTPVDGTFNGLPQGGLITVNGQQFQIDYNGGSGNDVVLTTLTGPPPTNQAPTVNAGSDQTITLPSTANLSGTATDDGLPNPPATLTTTWSKVSGPGTVTFGNAGSLNTTASFSQSGVYVLRLIADDGALTTTDDLLISVNPASTPFTVLNNNNSGPGSLRQAVLNANASGNANDTIDFAPNVRGKIVLTGFEIELYKPIGTSLTIIGPGADVLSIETNFAFRVFRAQLGNIKISGLRISRGNGFNGLNDLGAVGGGIWVIEDANLTLESCSITEHQGIGIKTMSGSTLTINNSLISGNGVAGIEGAGGLSISNSTIADNLGSGMFWLNGTVTLTNVTVSGNQGFDSGGITFNTSNATILNSTIANNGRVSPLGNVGGLKIENGATVNLKNTIIANNTGLTSDVNGTVVSQGNNLIGNTTGSNGFTTADLRNINPQLGDFANNGGATYTYSLRSTSPAINAGNNTGAPATDQRGVVRPQGAAVDIGAYESGVRPTAFGKIVFVSDRNGNRELYSIDSDGTNTTRLTTNSADDEFPDWSPDGSEIAFSTNRNGNFEIYTMKLDDTPPRRLTTNSVPDSEPAWSPDGSQIAFVRNGAGIFLMNADGTNQTALPNTTDGASPSWSPDGTQIVFTCINAGSAICKINADGTNRTPFLFNDALHYSPAWSPDGNSIAFSIDFDLDPFLYFYSPYNVNVIRPMRNATSLDEVVGFAPAFSPDGTKLAAHNFSDSGGDLYLRDADGGNPVLLINRLTGGNSSLPDWFGQNTLTGTNVTTVSGTVSVTFSGVSTGGTTTAVPIDPATAGTVPSGYSLGAGFPAYEITTTVSYTAPITVCLQVPSTTPLATFNALRILHYVNGAPTDATILPPNTPAPDFATKTICARVNSLSPFVVAESLAPTAANVSVGGQVSEFNGYGISRVRVSITNQNGETRFVTTNSFGFYRFDEIPAGETYIISAFHKRYQFISRVINVSEDVQNADFTAEPE